MTGNQKAPTVIYHRADYDGLFSAAVCKKFLPEDTNFIGWDYGDPLIEFPAEGRVFIVDLSPDCVRILTDENSRRLIWIDHHKSSIEKWDAINEWVLGYRIDGVAACRLCYQWFTHDDRSGGLGWVLPKLEAYQRREVSEPLALTLAGEHDVWDHRDPDAVLFQYGLTAGGYGLDDGLASLLDSPKEPGVTRGLVFPGDVETRHLVREGYAAMNWQREFALTVANERGYVREWEGLRFFILGSCHARGSMWFPLDSVPAEVDALMAWRYDGNLAHFSLYHHVGHEHHDLSQIAVQYGGGGHRGACGFALPIEQALEIVR
jgi:hypothetical protein